MKDISEIFLLGFYPPEEFTNFIEHAKKKFGVPIEYLQEHESSGTAGGLVQHQQSILRTVNDTKTDCVFVLNADICGDLPIRELVDQIRAQPEADAVILTTEATRDQSMNYGSVVVDQKTKKVLHYVEKPSTFVSIFISCGLYGIKPSFWASHLEPGMKNADGNQLWFETDIFPQLASEGKLYALHTTRWWSQTKTPG